MTRRPVERRSHEAGFSAPELITTLLLFVSLATAARPVFYDFIQTYNLHGAAREGFVQLQSTRMAAVAENARYRFSLNPSGKMTLSKLVRETGTWVRVERVKDWPSGSEGIDVAKGDTIIFSPGGNAPTSGSVVLRNKFGKSRALVVDPAGFIRIQ